MAVDLGYSRRLGERWAVGIVGRYMHLKRHDDTADALAVDLSVAWSQPLENVGSHSTLRVGGSWAIWAVTLGKRTIRCRWISRRAWRWIRSSPMPTK